MVGRHPEGGVMTKREFKQLQRDMFGGIPSHSELVKRGIAAHRAAGYPWGRPPKNKEGRATK